MGDEEQQIVDILVKYALYQPLSEEEADLLDRWRQRSQGHRALPDQMRDAEWIAEHRRRLQQVSSPLIVMPRSGTARLRKPALALFLTGIVVAGWLLLRKRQEGPLPGTMVLMAADRRAVLTHPDGSAVILDTVTDGKIVGQYGNVVARKTEGRTLSYSGNGDGVQMTPDRMTLAEGAAPWKIVLADGSRIVLRGGSSLEYCADLRRSLPVLEGEAWFGVARDASRPLTVLLGRGKEVRVLGTTFDARAVVDRGSVLLYSGSVRVRSNTDSLLLRPGEALEMDGFAMRRRPMSNAERTLAWRGRFAEEELFDFNNTPLADVLKAVGSWYGVRISNPDRLQGVAVTGKLPRSLPLEQLLADLQRVEKGHVLLRLRSGSINVVHAPIGG
ncbi:MAG TPA: FecR domain-containing protein [Puia sp.]|nr:FecR domain-containing protein [Puia sp.]